MEKAAAERLIKATPLEAEHRAADGRMVEFAGWLMPIQYAGGIIAEHLAVRRTAGLFDVCHMGRFEISGAGALSFLRYALTNDAASLLAGQSHYTILADQDGGEIDDAWLYRLKDDLFMLVVNASNSQKDFEHLTALKMAFGDVLIRDVSRELSMIALQGRRSESILLKLAEDGFPVKGGRGNHGLIRLCGAAVRAARTGYTGEPVGFELFVPANKAVDLWRTLCKAGAQPVGLGARDTLRLEAGLPLYGHEYGADLHNGQIPILAAPKARFGVALADGRRDFVGRAAIVRQSEDMERIKKRDFSNPGVMFRRVLPVRLTGQGIARAGTDIFKDGIKVGYVTSGTMVPYWKGQDGSGEEFGQRAIGLAMLDSQVKIGEQIQMSVRGRMINALAVGSNLKICGDTARPELD